MIYPHDLCYQYSKDGPGCLFGKLSIKDFYDEPHFPEIISLISSQIQMNAFFKTNSERKISICDRRIHKDIRIPVDINQPNKKFSVTVQPKNVCKLEFADNIWLPFLDQPQSDIVVLVIIAFHVYNILFKKWKHVICPNDIITFIE